MGRQIGADFNSKEIAMIIELGKVTSETKQDSPPPDIDNAMNPGYKPL